MPLAAAQALVDYAARIPKHGRIVDVDTLEVIDYKPSDACQYSKYHASQGIKATTQIPNGINPPIPACQRCEDSYEEFQMHLANLAP